MGGFTVIDILNDEYLLDLTKIHESHLFIVKKVVHFLEINLVEKYETTKFRTSNFKYQLSNSLSRVLERSLIFLNC